MQIEQVKLKHDDLSKRSADIKIARDLLPEVCDFIDQLRKMGRDVPPGANRDLLISLASFWATYYFQHSEENTYPSTTLEPYMMGKIESETSAKFRDLIKQSLGTMSAESAGGIAGTITSMWEKYRRMELIWRIVVFAVPLLVIIVAILIASTGNGGPGPKATATGLAMLGTQQALETIQAELTDIASLPITITPLPATPETLEPPTETSEPAITPEDTSTIVPVDTPAVTPTAGTGIENQGVSVQVTNLNDLQEVLPQMELNVSFANFTLGWSVHLLIQPLSRGLTYYPVTDYYLVEKGYGSGEWTVTVDFGSGQELDYREQYAITPVMATSDAAREALTAAVRTGLEQLPEGVFTSPQLITRVYTVVRQAYTVVNEARVVYSALDAKASNLDIYAMRLDGSDPLRLTDSPEISELYPSLSPDGMHIAFVGRQISQLNTEKRTFSLWVMNSDGANRVNIAQDPALIYDRPLWSPDGKTLAYNTSPADASVRGSLASWAIYLYDSAAGRSLRLDTGLTYARHPAWTPDGKALFFSAINPDTGTLGIYQISMDTQEVRRVYDEKANEIQPVVSPDGQRLLFLDYDSRELYILEMNTGRVELVKTPPVLDLGYAVWSPDGTAIYFEANTKSAYAIWIVELEEGEPRQLTPGNTELAPFAGLLVVYLPK